MIKGTQAQTGCQVNIEDNGTIEIAAPNGKGAKFIVVWWRTHRRARSRPNSIKVKVTIHKPHWSFVEIFPGRDGFGHRILNLGLSSWKSRRCSVGRSYIDAFGSRSQRQRKLLLKPSTESPENENEEIWGIRRVQRRLGNKKTCLSRFFFMCRQGIKWKYGWYFENNSWFLCLIVKIRIISLKIKFIY